MLCVPEHGETLTNRWFASILPCATMEVAFGERSPGYLESQGKLLALRVVTLLRSPWPSLTRMTILKTSAPSGKFPGIEVQRDLATRGR